jgi:hypothetical protein
LTNADDLPDIINDFDLDFNAGSDEVSPKSSALLNCFYTSSDESQTQHTSTNENPMRSG